MKVSIILLFVLLKFSCTHNCSDLTDLPCIEVFKCDLNNSTSLLLNQLATGEGNSTSYSEISICYDKSLQITISSFNQNYYPTKPFGDCNDEIYNSDVVELFISPWDISLDPNNGPKCYTEIEISPNNKMYEAGIYNPTMSQTGHINSLIDCCDSNIIHYTLINNKTSWNVYLDIPLDIINFPKGCPNSTTISNIYRVNFFRVNELVKCDQCDNNMCEYLAWNPTLIKPPAFHIPIKFGYLILKE